MPRWQAPDRSSRCCAHHSWPGRPQLDIRRREGYGLRCAARVADRRRPRAARFWEPFIGVDEVDFTERAFATIACILVYPFGEIVFTRIRCSAPSIARMRV